MIPAMAGEKADGTLESLMLAPVSRREVLWGKLIGRMTPVRRFMRASIPAFLLSTQCVTLTIGLNAAEGLHDGVAEAMVLMIFVVVGLAAAAVFWCLLLVDVHCAAAITLYCSARARGPVTASMAAYAAVFIPPIVMSCGYGAGLLYHFFAGPIMFSELIRNLDKFTIEAE
jgi:ABC-type Na+ efflux pump permease subunit